VFGCASAVAHIIAPSRGKAVVAAFLGEARPEVWVSDRLAAQSGHAEQHQICLAHMIRDAQYAIDDGDTVFAPGFKGLLKRACAIGRRRDDLADTTLANHRRDLDRRLEALLALTPSGEAGLKLGWAAEVYADVRSIVGTGQLAGRSPLAAIPQALDAGARAAM
jgi:transposase